MRDGRQEEEQCVYNRERAGNRICVERGRLGVLKGRTTTERCVGLAIYDLG